MRWQLGTILALGLLGACVERSPGDDGEERRTRCVSVNFEGVRADGSRFNGYVDETLGYTPQLCTCSTEEEDGDFSPGGYRDGYINELAYEECERISVAEGHLENSCEEQYEDGYFGLTYGNSPSPEDRSKPRYEWEKPLCGESDLEEAG